MAVLGLVLVAVKLLALGHELIIKNEHLAVGSTLAQALWFRINCSADCCSHTTPQDPSLSFTSSSSSQVRSWSIRYINALDNVLDYDEFTSVSPGGCQRYSSYRWPSKPSQVTSHQSPVTKGQGLELSRQCVMPGVDIHMLSWVRRQVK